MCFDVSGSMILMITRGALQEVEIGIERRDGIRTVIETGRETKIGTRKEIEIKIGVRIETGTGIVRETKIELVIEIGIVTEIAIGKGVIEVIATKIEKLMMITAEAETVTGDNAIFFFKSCSYIFFLPLFRYFSRFLGILNII